MNYRIGNIYEKIKVKNTTILLVGVNLGIIETDEEIIDFLIELYKQDPQAEKEYIKYYINAKQYFRYTEFAKQVKQKIKDINLII